MCGIAGIYSFQSKESVQEEAIKNMLGIIRHRGPDESGIYINENIGLGNVRLSIIDLKSGQQPLSDSSENYWIVFNGEIFNYIELREELQKKGYVFKTTSDTEVLVQLFAAYGPACLSKLNGQFVFAIWNERDQSLFIGRDRVGIRPLYYTEQHGSFYFGSEIKTLLTCKEVKTSINYKALSQILTFWTTISPVTFFKDIYELPPGHYMTIEDGKIDIKRYWSLDFPGVNERYSDINKAVKDLDELFYDAVRIRLRSDVQVAAYLSGGLDSTITTYYIKQIEPSALETFSIGFEDADFDETAYQLEASEYLQTAHKSIKIPSSQIATLFPEVIWHSEIPTIRTAPVPMHALSGLVKDNHIKVVITGEGADELFAGYNIFKEDKIRRFWAKYPNSKIRPLLLKKLYPYLPHIQNAKPSILKFFFGYKLDETSSPMYSHLIRWNNTSHLKRFLHKDILEELQTYNPMDEVAQLLPASFEQWDALSKAQWLELNIFMSGYLLSSQGDRMGMANSIEGRYPFLDHRVIEFSTKLPADFKLNGLNEKYILKKLIEGKIPDSILKRPKQAYRAPVANSFLSDISPDYVKNMLSVEQVDQTGVFNSDLVDKLVVGLSSGSSTKETDGMALTSIISTQLIMNKFMDRSYVKTRIMEPNNIKIVNRSSA